jgi:hypothetical protein
MSFRLAFAVLCIFFIACVRDKKQPNLDTWKTFATKTYSIQYPANWELDRSDSTKELVIFSPPDIITPLFRENFILRIESIHPDMDFDDYISFSKEQIKKFGGTIITSTRLDTTGNHYLFIYTANIRGSHIKTRQQIHVKEGQVYTLTYTTTIQAPDIYLKSAEKTFASFQVE